MSMQAFLQRRAMIPKPEPLDNRGSGPSPLSVEERLKFRETDEGKYTTFAEIRRVCDLPIRVDLTDEEVESYCYNTMQAKAFSEGLRLFPEQAQALWEYELVGGVVGALSVGRGKTMVALGIANIAFKKGVQKIVYLFPPQLLGSLMNKGIPEARRWLGVDYHVHVLGGRSSGVRQAMAKSGKPGLYLLPYSLLSGKDAHILLEGINAGLYIADESHRLNNRGSARTKRLMKKVEETGAEMVLLSGTQINKAPMEYHHLVRQALKQYCPLPHSVSLATEWSNLIDSKAADMMSLSRERDEKTTGSAGPLKPLVDWARQHFPEEKFPFSVPGFRLAYQKRFRSCHGVVVSKGENLGVSLMVKNHEVKEDYLSQTYGESWSQLKNLIRDVEEAFITPNGDEIAHAIHTWKWLEELSGGFYNLQYWPSVEEYIEHRPNISAAQAADMLERSKDQFLAEQEYDKDLRDFLKDNPRPGLDTPFLLGRDMALYGDKNVPASLYQKWKTAKDKCFEGMIERKSRAVRVCRYKIDAALKWYRGEDGPPKGKGALIWCKNIELAKWAYESFLEAGIETVYCPAGDMGNREILNPRNAHKAVIAAMAHGEGKNLQELFSYQYFIQFPRSARAAEQVLGRLHRTGQPADEIVANIFLHHEFEYMNFAACLNDALFIHQTTGGRQKLIYCNYDPMPRIFPPEVLRQRGLEIRQLDADGRRAFQEKFSTEA